MSEPLLAVRGLVRHFPMRGGLFSQARGAVRAVDGVDLDVLPGETLGLVGESGCGKTTLGRLIARLDAPTEGRILFECRDVASLDDRMLKPIRRHLQIVFQNPYASLNPRKTIAATLAEPLVIYGYSATEQRNRVAELLDLVGLKPEHARRFPHAFSGGELQRIAIARALALSPKLVVCDEPVSALDVSIRAQILNLLVELKERLGLAYLFVSHDLAVVRHISDRVAVMYLGRIVEVAPVSELYRRPRHPYTRALLAASPRPDRAERGDVPLLEGGVPDPSNPPVGCHFHPRCPHVMPRCREYPAPQLDERSPAHQVRCWLDHDGAQSP